MSTNVVPLPRDAAGQAVPASAPESHTCSDALAQLFGRLGIEHAYGVSGGAIAPFAEAVARSPLKVLHFRHEAGAAFAAIEEYLATGKPAVVFATTGPGMTNTLTGMVAARWDGAKVIFVTGAHGPGQRGRWPAQETSSYTLPTSGLFSAGPIFDFAVSIESEKDLDQVAWRLAAGLARPGPFVAHLSVPIVLQSAKVATTLAPRLSDYAAPCCSRPQIRRIAAELAEKPFVIWTGFGSRGASSQILALAERRGVPVMTTPRGKGTFPESHPLFIGVTGLGGHSSVEEYLSRYKPEYALVLGSRLAETASSWDSRLVPPGGFIHVDLDPAVPGAAFQTAPTRIVHSEVGAFLEALLEELPQREYRRAPEVTRPAPEALESEDEGAVRPRYLLEAIQRVFVEGSDAVCMAESGNSFAWAIHHLRFEQPYRFRVSSSFGSMGHFCAGVVGAALARKGKAVALVGDGSMLMNNEINTAVNYGAQAVWIVLNDARYGMVAQGMAASGMKPVEPAFPRVDFTEVARAMGAEGVRVERESQLEPALRQALESRVPFVVDVVIDPQEAGPWMRRIQNLILQGSKGQQLGSVGGKP